MKTIFDEKIANKYDNWFKTKKGLLVDRFEKDLILKLIDLKQEEKILDIGCGTGNYLQLFIKKGLKPVGVDISLPMLRVAQKKLTQLGIFCLAKSEALPFKTKSFDCVTIITTLEFVENPLETLGEAVRVSKKKIVLGVLNKYSLTGLGRRITGRFRPSIYNKAKFYSTWELKVLIAKVSSKIRMKWGSVLTLPLSVQQWVESIERYLSFKKNPFGAFLAIAILKKEE